MKKPSQAVGVGADLPSMGPSLIETTLPSVWEFATDTLWDDGSARALPTFLFFIEAGVWKLCVSDKALERVTFISGFTPDACLESFQLRLETDSVEWRAKKPFTPARKKS